MEKRPLMENMENTEPLVGLLEQLMVQLSLGSKKYIEYSPPRESHELTDYTLVTTDKQYETISAIFRELGDNHQFRGEWEVTLYIVEHLAASAKKYPSVLSDIAKGLRHPLQSYSFSAPVLMRSPVGYDIPLGGRHNLCLESVETPEGGYRPVLTGTTEACTPYGAIEDAEQAIRLILGAALALNTAVLTFQTPGFSSQIPISISPRVTSHPIFMEPALARVASQCLFIIPRDLSDLETAQMRKGDGSSATQRIQRNLVKLAAVDSNRAGEVRNAARLYLAGESSAASASSASYGMAVTYYFMCLEALLMEKTTKENIQARLTEAVAFRIGTSAESRADIRARVKKMYDDRSRFVHTGVVREKPGMREACGEMVRLVLQKAIEEL